MHVRGALGLALACLLAGALPASAGQISSGPLTAGVNEAPWHLTFAQRGGPMLSEAPAATLAFHTPAGWMQATDVVSARRDGKQLLVEVATTDPAHRGLAVRIFPAGSGVLALRATVEGDDSDVDATRIGFAAPAGERFFGFGERADALDQRGRDVADEVSGATPYPVPWLLSSRGYGFLLDRDEPSVFQLATSSPGTWSAEVQSHALALRVFAGPRAAQVLRRFTAATGRQPAPAQPWQFGPWFQTGQADAAPPPSVSAAETQLRYLPCGADRAGEAAEVNSLHHHGVAVLAHIDPMLCTSNQPLFSQAASAGALQTNAAGAPYTFDAAPGPVAQFDFTSQGAADVYGALVRRVLAAGHDGWLEDGGEDTPADVRDSADDLPAVIHNGYPTTYHCEIAQMLGRRAVVRMQRSGWIGSARCAQDVAGGDPATPGFDGLRAAVRQGLSIGMSGVSRWGPGIGEGAPELLERWIELGSVSAVMRAPQISDPGVAGVWRRYARLHTQLYPYLRAADAGYRATGMPLMRAPALIEAGAPATDDAFGFGDDLFAAPVVTAGQTRRTVTLPGGRWSQGLAYRATDGAWVARRAPALHGTRSVPAGLAELPLFVRAGALLPLLPAGIESLYRRTRFRTLRLLAFPHGRSQARIFDSERARSRLTSRDWTLTLTQSRRREVQIEAVLPWRACGRGVRTSHGVTRVTRRLRSGDVRLARC